MKTISRESLIAHNIGLELPTGNENYNKFHELGQSEERLRLENIAEDEYCYKKQQISKKFLKQHCGIEII